MGSDNDQDNNKLVPEDQMDLPSDDQSVDEKLPETLAAVSDRLDEAGYSCKYKNSRNNRWIEFSLPSGKGERVVVIHEDSADELANFNFSGWRSLERHDGIWNTTTQTIEVLVRGEKFGAPVSLILRRIEGILSQNKETALTRDTEGDVAKGSEVRLHSETGPVVVELGESTVFAGALSDSTYRRPMPGRRIISMRILNATATSTSDADSIVETISDALFFDLYITHRIRLSVRRLQKRGPVTLGPKNPPQKIAFPCSSYPHAPVTLFNTGTEIVNSALIRYWAFYQVLEFYFPKYHQAESINRLARYLKSPRFDPHRNQDVIEAAKLAAAATGFSSEEEQLLATLRALLTPRELQEIVSALGYDEELKKKSELTNCTVRIADEAECITALGKRIYDIRCRIVHSKSGSSRESSPGLIPGTHHDDLVQVELALMEEIAHRAIVASGERLHLPT